MCYLSVFFDPKSLCLQQASTSAGRFVEGKQLHLTFCFLHQISDNISSLLVAGRNNPVSVGCVSSSFSSCFPLGVARPGADLPEGQPGGASVQLLPLRR